MKIEKSIAAGIHRSAEQTCADIIALVTDILRARSYPNVQNVRSGFEPLLPLLRFLLTTQGLDYPALTIVMPDLEIEILVSYEPAVSEDFTLLSPAPLSDLTATDIIWISIHSVNEVAPPLRDLPATASTKNVRFRLIVGDGPVPGAARHLTERHSY
jgi:hypothetical protein